MNLESPGYIRYQADQTLRNVRHKAFLQDLLATLTGKSNDLLPFEEVRQLLRAQSELPHPMPRMIPIDRIIGSVGRYRDFTRTFLPRPSISRERWLGIDAAMLSQRALPPIEVYQLGDVYFVKDGNHRVSVAKANGATEIEAYVTEIPVKVPPEPGDNVNDLIIKAEYADFLEKTYLNELRPGADIRLTVPGRYQTLLDHIRVHQYYLGLERQAPVSWEEAVTSWYDNVYLPAIRAIQEQDVLRHFKDRTPADFYVWVMDRLQSLRDTYEVEIPPDRAAAEVAHDLARTRLLSHLVRSPGTKSRTKDGLSV